MRPTPCPRLTWCCVACMAERCSCLVCWLCCWYLNTKTTWTLHLSRDGEQPVVVRKARIQPQGSEVKELRLSTSYQTHARERQGWISGRGQGPLREILFFTEMPFLLLWDSSSRQSTSWCPVLSRWAQHASWVTCPCPLAPLQERIFSSPSPFSPSSSLWPAPSSHLCSHCARHRVFSFSHCYSAISVISELIRDHSGLAQHAHTVPQRTLDPLSYTTQFGPKPSALLYGSPQSPRLSEQLQLQQRWAPCHQQHPWPSSGWQGLIRKWNIS